MKRPSRKKPGGARKTEPAKKARKVAPKKVAKKARKKPDLGVDDLDLETHATAAAAAKPAQKAAVKKAATAPLPKGKPDLGVDDLDLENH